MGHIYKKINTVPAADLEAGVYIEGEDGDFLLITEINDIYDGEYPAVEVVLRDHWGEESSSVISYDVVLEIFSEKE